MYKIQFILITKDGNKVTNNNPFVEDEDTDNVGCVVEFDQIPMIQDYNIMVNKIARYKQFEVDSHIVKFETQLIK